MKILGLDYGDSRIGVAVSDDLMLTAQPVCTISEKTIDNQLSAVLKLIEDCSADTVVIGLPINMNGSVGERAKATQVFGEMLKAHTGAKIIYHDERLSSSAAHRVLSEGNVSGKKRKGLVDKLAAVFILQSYLDGLKRDKYQI